MSANIKHLIVLMMENRSFDHMLGYLKSPDYPIEGLVRNEYNDTIQGGRVLVTPDAPYSGALSEDPRHDTEDVFEQIFGTRTPTPEQQPDMSGFVRNYQRYSTDGGAVMRCFGPGRLPVLETLAKSYAICDQWFSSVPGQTLPNRAYALAGTSLGRLDGSFDWSNGTAGRFTTIFEVLYNANITCAVFHHDMPAALGFDFIYFHESQILLPIDSFATLCQQNQLPAYCFIEPRYTPQTDGDGYYAPNDQHPDYDVALGEGLIKRVYDALRSNDEVWMSSLLLIVYDEHGGLYDHVRPPRAIPPDAVPCDTPRFDFSRLGVRVPAILVSPYIQAGRIVSDVFDHTSILATAMSLFDPSSWPSSVFGQRARVARPFHTYLRLNQPPRMDNPFASLHDVMAAPQATSIAPQQSSVAPRPLSELQRALVRQAAILEGRMIRTDREAGDYLSRVMANIRRRKQ